jgi:transcriptional regulator with XRE-family HTH domain
MPTKQELGRRLRIARFDRNLTLKEVANRCGMSATHISEVERGKTSPTIGALQRITAALGERTSYFVSEENIPGILLTKGSDRGVFWATDSGGQPMDLSVISRGLPRGTLQIFTRRMPAGKLSAGCSLVAEVVFICQKGSTRITVLEESHVLCEGDALQTRLDDGYTTENVGEEENEVLLIMAAPTLVPI